MVNEKIASHDSVETHIADVKLSELDLKEKIRYETLNTLSSSGAASFVISIVNALLVYFTLREIAEPIVLNVWISFILLITSLRTAMIIVFRRLDSGSPRLALWSAVYFVFVYSSGLGWGILPLLNVFYSAGWTETFIVFVISGMSAGGLVSLYASLYAAIPYQLFILLPLIYTLADSGAPAHTAMALLASMYLMLLLRSSYALNRAASNTIRLEMENNELFNFLLKAKR